MKKTVLFILSISMCGILLAGCKNKTQGNAGVNKNLVETGETTSIKETLDEKSSEKEMENESITVPAEKSTTVEPTASPTTAETKPVAVAPTTAETKPAVTAPTTAETKPAAVAATQPATATPTKPAPAKTYNLKKNQSYYCYTTNVEGGISADLECWEIEFKDNGIFDTMALIYIKQNEGGMTYNGEKYFQVAAGDGFQGTYSVNGNEIVITRDYDGAKAVLEITSDSKIVVKSSMKDCARFQAGNEFNM